MQEGESAESVVRKLGADEHELDAPHARSRGSQFTAALSAT